MIVSIVSHALCAICYECKAHKMNYAKFHLATASNCFLSRSQESRRTPKFQISFIWRIATPLRTNAGSPWVVKAFGTRIAIAKWWGHKAQCHVTASLSDSDSPGCCLNHGSLSGKGWEYQVKSERVLGTRSKSREVGQGLLELFVILPTSFSFAYGKLETKVTNSYHITEGALATPTGVNQLPNDQTVITWLKSRCTSWNFENHWGSQSWGIFTLK